jgi:photosystem II stability/assembly factor-like uncharacterized protein
MIRRARVAHAVWLSILFTGCIHTENDHDEGERGKEVPVFLNGRSLGRPVAQSNDPAYQVTPEGYAKAIAHRDLLPPAPLFAGSDQSVRVSDGAHPDALFPFWQYIGPTPFQHSDDPNAFNVSQSGRINAVAFDAQHNGTWWVGAPYGGVWKSTDFGNSWHPMSDGWASQEVSSLAVDPHNGNVVYAGTGDLVGGGFAAQGIMKSSDGGATWSNIGGLNGETVTKIIIGPGDSNTILAATASRLVRSTDGGATWTTIPGSSGIEWTDIAYGAPNFFFPEHWYAVGSGANGTVWTSTDGGATWSALTSPFSNNSGNGQSRIAVACSQIHPSYVVIATGNGDQKVYSSGDFGATWSDITGNIDPHDFYQGAYSYGLAVTTVGDTSITGHGQDLIWILGTYVYQSFGGGQWTSVNNGHDDVHAIAVNPFNQYSLLIGNDGGVYNLTYQPELGTTTTFALNKTLGVTEIYEVATYPANNNWFTVGTQDTGTATNNGNISSWTSTYGQDGGGVAINPGNVNIQYASENFAVGGGRFIRRTSHDFVGDGNVSDITPSIGNEPALMNEPMLLDPNNSNQLYIATNWLYRWDESTQKWTNHLGGKMLSGGGSINAVAIAPSDSNRIYTASGDGQLWMSKDGGTSFTMINGNVSTATNEPFTSLSVNPSNKDDVLAGAWRGATVHLWRTTNPTAANVTWSDVTNQRAPSGLPNTAVNSVVRDPFNPGTSWYVGTDIGVFYTDDSGVHWYNATRPLGLPGVPIEELIVTRANWLVAATYGRGLWRALLGCNHRTCAAVGANCGTINDGCGLALDCGSCFLPATCGGGGVANVCGVCQPKTCAQQGATCGTIGDGCGGVVSCGNCGAGAKCRQNQCVTTCVPTSHCRIGQCGVIDDDGCGNMLCCGKAKSCCL